MPIDQRRAIVRAETLLATEMFQSTEETRYYLNGTCIRATEHGPMLVATDGHAMIVMREVNGFVSGLDTVWNCQAKKRLSALLTASRKQPKVGRNEPRDLWVDLQYGNPGGPTMTARVAESAEEIKSGGGQPQMMITDNSLYVDGSFPENARLFPVVRPPKAEDEPSPWKGPIGFNNRYLQRFAELARLLGERGNPVMFGSPSLEGPTLISIGGRPDVACLLMPMRMADTDIPYTPEWIVPLAPAEASVETQTVKRKKAA